METKRYTVFSGTADYLNFSESLELGVWTNDTDGGGYLVENGTARGLYAGLSDEFGWLLVMSTNGEDIIVPDSDTGDYEDFRLVCLDMSDTPDRDIKQGAKRLMAACNDLAVARPEAAEYAETVREFAAIVLGEAIETT